MTRPALLAALTVALAAPALAAPARLAWQARLLDAAGAPLHGPHDVSVALYAAEGAAAPLWTDTYAVSLADGYAALELGAGAPLDLAAFATGEVWAQASVDGQPAGPRTRLLAVPFAHVAGAVEVDTGLSGGCAVPGAVRFDAGAGTLVACDGAAWVPLATQGSVSWAALPGKPGAFPPDTHGHTSAEISDFAAAAAGSATWTALQGKPATFPPSAHTHTAASVTDFSTAANSAVTWSSLSGKPSTFTPAAHSHTAANVSDFNSAAVSAVSGQTWSALTASGKVSGGSFQSANGSDCAMRLWTTAVDVNGAIPGWTDAQCVWVNNGIVGYNGSGCYYGLDANNEWDTRNLAGHYAVHSACGSVPGLMICCR